MPLTDFDVKFEGLNQSDMLGVFNGEQPTDRVPSTALTPIAGIVNGFPANSILTLAVRGQEREDGSLQQLVVECQAS